MLDFAKTKEFWDNISKSEDYARHRKEIKEKYDAAFAEAPAILSYHSYIKEETLEKLWLRQLFQLQSSAILSLMYPDNEEYIRNLTKVIWVICSEYSWAPIDHHNSYFNTTAQDYDPTMIDIYAASIGFSLAEIKNLLGDRLPNLVRERMTAEIKRRIIDSFLEREFFWETHDNNWTAVCAGAVGSTFMYEAPEAFEKVKHRFISAMEHYLAPYADDGVCVEGAAYWGFGFGFFAIFASLLLEFTKGKEDLFKLPKVKAIASFIQKTFLDRNTMITFSDCNLREGYWIGLPHMLRSIYGNLINKLPADKGTIMEYHHFAFSLRSVIYYKKEFTARNKLKPVIYNLDKTGWFIKRCHAYGIALKGGTNGESHNHNDVGSFILSCNNKQILLDLGAGTYSPAYHGKERYTFFHPSSLSHNVPYFGDAPQDGRKRDRVIIDYNDETETAKYEFASAYGLDYVRKIERSFKFYESSLVLIDEFDVDEGTPITERFVTREIPKVDGNTVILDGVKITVDGCAALDIKTVEAPLHSSEGSEKIYCIDYTLSKGDCRFEAKIEMPV